MHQKNLKIDERKSEKQKSIDKIREKGLNEVGGFKFATLDQLHGGGNSMSS